MKIHSFSAPAFLLRKSNSFSKILKNTSLIALLLIVFAGCKKVTEDPGIVNLCPLVVSTDPADKAVNVVLNKVISVTFNADMNATTINSSTFIIRQGTTIISGIISPTTLGTTFTFTPTVPLLPFTVYTGTVTTGAKDKFGTAMAADYVWSFTTIPVVRLLSNPPAGGTTSGAGAFAQGSTVTVTATPNPGYSFINWTDSGSVVGVSTSTSYQFTMNGNRTLVANFSLVPPVQFTVTLSSNPPAGGTTFGQGTYNVGSTVTVIASSNVGYNFANWTENGIVVSTSSSYQFIVTGNRTLVANFTVGTAPPLFTSIFGVFGGSAGITNQGINTIINNGAIGTTAASTLITGFHDGLTGDVYTETPLNIGLVTGGIYTAPPPPGTAAKFATATAALAAANAFYISISPANRSGTVLATSELGGLTLTPGTYRSPSGPLFITSGNLTLDAQGNPNAVWVFQAPTSLTVGVAGPTGAKSVILTNGAQARNVYWYVGSAATINGAGGGVMVGNIFASSGVTFSTAGNTALTVLNGRAISLVASVTMVNTIVNVPN